MFVLVSLLLRHWLPHGSLQVGSCTAFVSFTLPLCQYIGSNFMHEIFLMNSSDTSIRTDKTPTVLNHLLLGALLSLLTGALH